MNKENEREKYLIKNTLIFTLGNVATKFITFFLVPLYTNSLTTAEYGTIDLVTTICNVLAPIVVLNIWESVLRFSLDKEANHIKIMSIGILIYLISIFISALAIPTLFHLWKDVSDYTYFIYFYTITCAGAQLFLCYLRGKELLVQYSIGNVIQSLLLALLNVVFLLKCDMGINGYFLAMIISSLITIIYAVIVGNIWSVIIDFSFDNILLKKMIQYSVVLIPNTFLWWIMNASDRIMVTSMVGVTANGIYAISYKLPSLVSTITSIFNQAWNYSAIKEEDSLDVTEYSNKILNTLISVTMLIGIGIISFSKLFLKIYVAPSYYEAWHYIPFLTIGCVYLTIGTFMATSYSVHKDSFGFLFSSMFGAIFNIALNFLLIPRIKVYGAAVSTGVSYIAVFIFRLKHTQKYMKYNVLTKEFVIGSFLLLSTSLIMFVDNYYGKLLQLVVFIVSSVFYANIWIPIIKRYFTKKEV